MSENGTVFTVGGRKMKVLNTFLLFIAVHFTGCTPTYTPVYPESVNIKTIIKTGDTVKVTTKDKEEYEFIVVEITENAIVGESEKLLFEDIYNLQKMVATSGENTARGIGGAVLITIYSAGAAADAF